MKAQKVKICGVSYTIHFVKAEEITGKANESSCWGITDHMKQKVLINKESTQDMQEDTLLHELQHCIWANSGLAEFCESSGISAKRNLKRHLFAF